MRRAGSWALYPNLYAKTESEPFLCPGEGVIFNHVTNLATGSLNPVTEALMYFAAAAPYSTLECAVPAQSAGVHFGEIVLLGFRVKYTKNGYKFLTGAKTTSYAKNMADVELCIVNYDKNIKVAMLDEEDMGHFAGSELRSMVDKLFAQHPLLAEFRARSLFTTAQPVVSVSVPSQMSTFEAIVDGKLNLDVVIAMATFGIKNISASIMKPFQGAGTVAKGLSKSAKNDVQAKYCKLGEDFVAKALMTMIPINKQSKQWLQHQFSEVCAVHTGAASPHCLLNPTCTCAQVMLEHSPMFLLRSGAPMQVEPHCTNAMSNVIPIVLD